MYIDLDQKLLISLKNKPSLGLFNGKMGICTYFYYMGRLNNDKSYYRIANQLLDEIYSEIDKVKEIGFHSGLSGIGLGLNYLISNHYVKGNQNLILGDIDNEVLKKILYEDYYTETDLIEIIPILYYLCERLIVQGKDSISEKLFQETIIYCLNNIYAKMPSSLFHEEPFVYNSLQYYLPQFLFVLSKILNLGFYNQRIIKVLEEITPYISSFIPTLQANRLYLLSGMYCVKEHYKSENWNRHLELLKYNIDIDIILTDEFSNKNIYFADGLPSMFYCLLMLKNYLGYDNTTTQLYAQAVQHKINMSDVWNLLYSNIEYFDNHRGLIYGYCGTSLLYNIIKKQLQ